MSIDLSNVEDTSFETIPPGEYKVSVEKAEIKPTKAGTGEYLKVEFVILDGEHAQWKLWHNFNVKNPNEKAVQIGKQQLKSFLIAAGYADPTKMTDVATLSGLQCLVVTKIRKSEGYPDAAEIKTFLPVNRVGKNLMGNADMPW